MSSTTPPIPAFISLEELSELLDVPVATIRSWRATGKGPRAYRVGGRIRFTMPDILDWLESRRDPSAGGAG